MMKRKFLIILAAVLVVLFTLLLVDHRFKLFDRNIGVEFDAYNSQLIIRDKRMAVVYTIRLDNRINIEHSRKTWKRLILSGTYRVNEHRRNPIRLTIDTGKTFASITMEVTEHHKMQDPVYLEAVTPDAGEYFFVIPYAEGMLLPTDEEFPFNEFYLWGYKATMPFVGFTDLRQGMMIISEDPWDTSVDFEKPNQGSNHHLQIRMWPERGSFSQPRKLLVATIADDGYVTMAGIYRNYRDSAERVQTLRDKAKNNQNTEKLTGACDFWLLNELRDKDFIDRLMEAGISKAVFSFYESWYIYEHAKAPELIRYAENLGFLTGRYDIDTDVWNPQDIPVHLPHIRTDAYPEDVVMTSGGAMKKNFTRYLGGKPVDGYTVCSTAFWKYGKDRIDADLAENSYNTRFFDAIISIALTECYSPQHPMSRREDMQNRKTYLKTVRERYGLIMGTEDIRDYAVNLVDYNEGVLTLVAAENASYSWLEPVENPGSNYESYNMDAARRIPLFQLVYHDSLASTWYTGDSVSKVPAYWKKKDLFTVLYGAMPLIMPKNLQHWKEREEDFLSSIHLAGAFFECVGAEKMVSHKFVSSDRLVQKTVFSNGWEVVGNFSEKNIRHGKYTLPPNGFYATNGEEEIYRILSGDSLLDVVSLKDRFFINPYGKEVSIRGITTDQIVYRQFSQH